MSTLRQLAKDGHTVICSIHQPRSSIFRMFDDVMLLSEGRVMFQGRADRVARYFRSRGHAMPANTNPGDFVVDVVSVDYTSKVLCLVLLYRFGGPVCGRSMHIYGVYKYPPPSILCRVASISYLFRCSLVDH